MPANHAAFWDGHYLDLTPAYDLCPQLRSGAEANQAMGVTRDGRRGSTFATCLAGARDYGLSVADARAIIDYQVTTIPEVWHDAAEAAELTSVDRAGLFQRQILNPYAFT